MNFGGDETQEQVAQGGCGVPSSGDVQITASPEQPAVGDPASRGWFGQDVL